MYTLVLLFGECMDSLVCTFTHVDHSVGDLSVPQSHGVVFHGC